MVGPDTVLQHIQKPKKAIYHFKNLNSKIFLQFYILLLRCKSFAENKKQKEKFPRSLKSFSYDR